MRPVVNDRFICCVEGASASLRFNSQKEAESAQGRLLAAGLIDRDSFFEYRKESPKEGEHFMEPITRDRLPPIYHEDGKFAIHIPLRHQDAAASLLADAKPDIVLPEKLSARLVFEDRFAALNAQEILLEKGCLDQEQHFTEMRKETGFGAAPFEYAIEIPRQQVMEALEYLRDIRGLPTSKRNDAPRTR